MFKRRKNSAYPVLDGKALVNVSLKKSLKDYTWLEKLTRRIKHYMVNRQVQAYFYDGILEDVPMVTLDSPGNNPGVAPVMELDLNRDKLSPFSRVKIALSCIATAGLVVLAAWGLGDKVSREINPEADSGSTLNVANLKNESDAKEKSPVLKIESDKESILAASLITPATEVNTHRFDLAGHANTSHTNYTYSLGHSNSHSNSHQNATQGHTNTSEHQNWSDSSGEGGGTHSNSITAHTNESDNW